MKRVRMALLLVLGAFVVYMVFFWGRVRLDDISVSEDRFAEITAGRQSGDSGLLEALFFDGQELSFDASAGVFYYSIAEGSYTAYNPYVKFAAKEGVSLAALDARITAEDIKENKTYRLIAYSDTTYYEYGLKCTTLPLMNITCASEIGDEDVQMSMSLFDNRSGVFRRVKQSDGNIHVRGGSTTLYPKKGYKISLTEENSEGVEEQNKLSLLGMRKDDDWILYAAYNDQEKIRNVFSANLWKYTCAKDNALGVDNGVEYKYIELFVNHEYWGLYALGYKVDELQLGIDTEAGGRLYQKNSWDSEEFILSAPNAAVAGYETDETVENAWGALKEYYTTLHLDWENSETMYAGIDVNNAIDLYLFVNLIQGLDHTGVPNSLGIKNMYLSFHEWHGREIVLYTPWDMDVTWGCQWTGDSATNLVTPYGTPADQNTVMGLGNLEALILNGDDAVWELILTKYRTLREGLWSEEYLNALLDGYEADIYGSGAYLREMERWQDGTYWDPEKGLDDFRSYVSERLKETDDYYRRVEALVSGDTATKNIYIIRSAQYKNFLESDFILAVKDKSLLAETDYSEFLEYIGIDAGQFTENVQFAVVSGTEKTVRYLETLDVSEELCALLEENEGITLLFGSAEGMTAFDFSRQYVMWSYLCERQEPGVWCDELRRNGYDVVIEIVNHDSVWEEKFRELLEGFGVDADSVTERTDFIVVDTARGNVTVLDDSHASGTRADTALGAFSLFYNDAGGYGVYMDGSECMLVQPQDNEGVDVRVSVLSGSPYEVVWQPTFTYQSEVE